MKPSETMPQDIKKVFQKLGTCSRTFCYLLNREFDHLEETEERAADPFAGGIIQNGHQCGMLWGSALAVGAESFRRYNDRDKAIGMAITATAHIMESFVKKTKSVNCLDITGVNFLNKLEMLKYMVKFILHIDRSCFDLAEEWAPEAIQSAEEGLSRGQTDLPELPISCASQVAQKMGASDEEMVMVAGFAGGLGLSGNACGALGAAIWMNSIAWCRKNPNKSAFFKTGAKGTLNAFNDMTDSKILCEEICGQRFKSVADHTLFIKNGGCEKLINEIYE